MIKQRLKELEIKITELANYLQISRPTMYKFIELYDSGKRKEVSHSINDLFDYIEDNPLIGKRSVINYILTKMGDIKDTDVESVNLVIKSIKKYVSENPESEKTQFLKKCSEHSQYDLVIHYLMDITPLLKKKKLLTEEVNKLKPYEEIISIYTSIDEEEK